MGVRKRAKAVATAAPRKRGLLAAVSGQTTRSRQGAAERASGLKNRRRRK